MQDNETNVNTQESEKDLNITYNPRTPEQLKPYQWKKGVSANPLGRPKGKTMKEYVKEYLERMTNDERDAWLEGLDKDVIWRMAEGNPTEDRNIKVSAPTPILGGASQAVNLPASDITSALEGSIEPSNSQ